MGQFCPGPVTFKCDGIGSNLNIKWVLNDTEISDYVFSPTDEYPHVLSFPSSLNASGEVIYAIHDSNESSIDFSMTLIVWNVSVLNEMSLFCKEVSLKSNNLTISIFNEGKLLIKGLTDNYGDPIINQYACT